LPAAIARAGEKAAWRFIEFFTANIRNENTRAAYAQAVREFFSWCEALGFQQFNRIQPVVIAFTSRAAQCGRIHLTREPDR